MPFFEIPLAKKFTTWYLVVALLTFYNNFLVIILTEAFQDSEIKTNNQTANTDSWFYFYDYTAKLLYDINDTHQAMPL
jgi:hypothetical protein